jgi:GH25 family lysozyme M1 (1,4-beta-N-acetylmuramidase)
MPEGSFIKGKLLLMLTTSPTKRYIYSISLFFCVFVFAAVLGLMCPTRAFATTSENISSTSESVTATAEAAPEAETSEEDSTKTTSSAEGIASSNANSASSVSQSSTTAADTASSAESSEAATTTTQEADSGEASDTTNNEGSGDDSAAGVDDSIAANDNSETSSDKAASSEDTTIVTDVNGSAESSEVESKEMDSSPEILVSNEDETDTNDTQGSSLNTEATSLDAKVSIMSSSVSLAQTEDSSLNGIDISSAQAGIDISALTTTDFVVVKVTQGTSYTNPYWSTWASATLKAGKLLGLYHYASGGDATQDASYFASAIKGYIGKAILMLDWEGIQNSLFGNNDESWVSTFREQLFDLTGASSLVYASLSVFQNQLSGVADSDRWVAQYAYDDERAISDYQSSPWNEDAYSCLIRQYTSRGQIAGYRGDLDLDKFYGSRSDWEKLASLTSAYRDGVNYSGVYDYTYYVDNYSDLYARYGANNDKYGALTYFITFGMSEARQASASFNVKSYRLQYKDLRAAYGNDWKTYYLHYIAFGQREGRAGTGCTTLQGAVTTYNGIDYAPVYDYAYYYSHNADLQRAYGPYDDDALLQHFITFGMSEARQASASFNVKSYRLQYKDLRAAYGNDWKTYYLHYIAFGQREGRQGV